MMITTLSEATVKARKAHRCAMCAGEIAVGESHYTQSCAEAGQAWTYRAHVACRSLEQEYWAWCGYELVDLVEDDHVDVEEFRWFLAQRRGSGA